jgi:hypothetical protein
MRHSSPGWSGFDVVARQGTEVTEWRSARWIVCHDPRMSMSHTPLEGPMYVTLGRNGEPALGFTWRIWASRTSFYLKSRAPHMQHLKLSLHSNDPRHPSGGGFKMAMDPEEKFEQDLADGKIAAQRHGVWPVWFPGKPLNTDATLVARLRWTWDACNRLGPAPEAGSLKRDATGLAAPPPPEPGDAVDIDLIVSHEKPYWVNEPRARSQHACLGPLRNDAGDWLTGTVVKRRVGHYPPPASALGPKPSDRADEMRAVGSAADPTGFLWLIEQRMSKAGLGQSS